MQTTDELFLLLTRDDGRSESQGAPRGYGLVGALMAELIEVGRVDLDDSKDPRVSVLDSSPTGDPVLDHGLHRLVEQGDGKRLSAVVADGKMNPEKVLVQRLQDQGVVGHEPKRMLGLVGERFPTLDPAPEQRTRGRLVAVLQGAQAPERADATLLSVLHGLGVAHRVLKADLPGTSSRELKRQIEEVVARTPPGDAVGRAVEALQTAIISAAIIPTVIATTTSTT